MYIPNSFAERDEDALFAFIEAHPLATVVTAPPDGLIATHLPLVLARDAGPAGTLLGHFARANPHARAAANGPVSALVIVLGPDAYITPAWYQTKQETGGRVVPTWNYVAVHAYCTMRVVDDPSALRDHLESLTHQHESSRPHAWQVSDAPDAFIAAQMKAIVGVRLEIDRLEGKWKMSQNRSDADIAGVIRGLGESAAPRDLEVAEIVNQRRPSRGPAERPAD